MAHDDWRIRIEVPEVETFLERLGLRDTPAEDLAEELRDRRLAATHDGDSVFVYAESAAQADRARELVTAQLAEDGIANADVQVEQWLDDEERWSDEPAGPSVEEDLLERGYAPWEVRVECDGWRESRDLADQLRDEGYSVSRAWHYVFVGTETREEAEELAKRVHGTAEPGGEMVHEVTPNNPFAIFGGLAG
jgi:hypothetical protein